MDGPYSWNYKLSNCKFLGCPTHTMAQVIKTKPMLMVLEWSVVIFNLETWITWNRNSTYWFCKCWSLFCIWVSWFFGVLNIELQIWMGNVQYAIGHQYKCAFNFRPPRNSKNIESLELDGDCWMCTSSTKSGLEAEMDTRGREKFIWLGWWESLSAHGRQSASCLTNPNTSFPLRCRRWFVKDDPYVKFTTTAASLARSLNPYALLNNNSFLSSPCLFGPPWEYFLYNIDCLKARTL